MALQFNTGRITVLLGGISVRKEVDKKDDNDQGHIEVDLEFGSHFDKDSALSCMFNQDTVAALSSGLWDSHGHSLMTGGVDRIVPSIPKHLEVLSRMHIGLNDDVIVCAGCVVEIKKWRPVLNNEIYMVFKVTYTPKDQQTLDLLANRLHSQFEAQFETQQLDMFGDDDG